MNRLDDISARYLRPMKPIPTGAKAMLGELEPYDGMFFDVYGTLLVSGAGEVGLEQNHRADHECLPELFARYGIALTPRELGERLKEAIEANHRIQKKRGTTFPEVDIRRIWQDILPLREFSMVERFAWEYEWITNPVFPMPGAATVIRACMANRVRMGIISNAQFYTEWLLVDLFGKQLYTQGFDARLRFFSWRERQAKPSEAMFRKARERLKNMGISVESVLYVGNDMLNDIRPAAAVGFQTALFAGDRRSLRSRDGDDRCVGVRPDVVVTDLRQLLAAIGTPSSGG